MVERGEVVGILEPHCLCVQQWRCSDCRTAPSCARHIHGSSCSPKRPTYRLGNHSNGELLPWGEEIRSKRECAHGRRCAALVVHLVGPDKVVGGLQGAVTERNHGLVFDPLVGDVENTFALGGDWLVVHSELLGHVACNNNPTRLQGSATDAHDGSYGCFLLVLDPSPPYRVIHGLNHCRATEVNRSDTGQVLRFASILHRRLQRAQGHRVPDVVVAEIGHG